MKEYRICEIRAKDPAGSESLILEGMPIIYDQATDINDPAGIYTEVIQNGALDNTDLTDARLLYNHDLNKVPLARTPKTMKLTRDPAGLKMVATLPDTPEAKSVHTAVTRGDLSGLSFAFKVPEGGDSYNAETNTRTIHRIDKIYEISIVPFPAYSQTSVEARAAIKAVKDDPARETARIRINQILMKEV